MKQRNRTLKTGLALAVIGAVVLFIERITNTGVSRLIGKLYCGERYMTGGQVGDVMCGFNMDMVIGMASFLLIVVGLVLLLIGLVKLIIRRAKKK